MYIHVYMFVSEILLAYLNNTSHIHSIEKTSNMYVIDIQCIYYIYVIILYTNIYIYIHIYNNKNKKNTHKSTIINKYIIYIYNIYII